jgi:DNA-binding transcriptional LysR family regulator
VELRQLRYFLAVAEERHFGRAAERLRIAQSGLSQQIRVLERSLKVELFIRDRRHVELTEAGEFLQDEARLIVELADRAVAGMRLAADGKRSMLKVGTSIVGSHPLVDRVLEAFRTRFPELEVQIHPGTGPPTLEALSKWSLDAAFVFGPFDPVDTVSYRRLGTIETVLALPEGHRLASFARVPRAELAREPFLAPPRALNPTLTDHVYRSLFGREQAPRTVPVADATESSRLLLVARGKGIALIGFAHTSDLRIPGVVFRPLEESPPAIEFGVAWREDHFSPLVPALVDLASAVAAREAPLPTRS